MLRGRYGNTSTAPYIEGYVNIPRLNIAGPISFLIDSGSDVTVLMPIDSIRLEIDFVSLINRTESEGIGGLAVGYEETAIITFSDRHHIYSYAVDVEISAHTNHNAQFPSLLGRDIINRWRCTLDFERNKVRAEPRTWDFRKKIV
jgi:hypothetical protein